MSTSQKRRFVLKLIFLFHFVCDVSASVSENEVKCIKSYLNHEKSSSQNDYCSEVILSHEQKFRDLQRPSVTSCIFSTFIEYEVFHLYLKGFFYHQSASDKNQTKYEKEVDETIRFLTKKAKQLCVADNKYKEEFDSIYDNRKPSLNNSIDEICARKYFIDKNILQAKDFGFDVSSMNITICDLFYYSVYEKLFERDYEEHDDSLFFGMSPSSIHHCITKKFRERKLSPKLYAVSIMMKFQLTSLQISKLRSEYVNSMKSFTILLFECIKES
ncbi:CLUMA_CG017441, isoform A [Clunio marinus]|uniref:CLUMA_CG017441, isoform A n=1 Tax=Clunio marinus TaxID=568069 RepID=A0A1J1IXQ4_9DIPT|nr:CLUMA_CG017441, isoform A [Clunio marinus]